MKKIFSIFLIWTFIVGCVSNCGTLALEEKQNNSIAVSNKRALVIGGTSGLGLATAVSLKKQGYDLIIVGRKLPDESLLKLTEKDKFIEFNLINDDLSFLDDLDDINVLIFAAGFGRLAPFSEIMDTEIKNSFKVNTEAAIRVIKKYYNKIASSNDFYSAVITSVAGDMSSPLFSLYAATKSALSRFIESVNIELETTGFKNRILNVSPGYLEGTGFYGSQTTEMDKLLPVSENILTNMFAKENKIIPLKKELYEKLIKDYQNDPHAFGVNSYKYKINSNRKKVGPQVKVGYLCGTFDLFHIGHLNILRNAKKYCDYLVVGVHKDGSHKGKETFIPFEERMDIVKNIKYVDECMVAPREDSDAYDTVKYDYLFVGSDYKGSEKFNRFEKYFADKNVKMIYLPYTQTTSSTQLRQTISNAA